MPEEKPKKKEEVVDGEVVAEFDDHTLMNLPTLPGEEEPADAQPDAEVNVGRRQFITRLTVGGVAALALGGSAALLLSRRRDDQPIVVLPHGSLIGGDDDSTDVASLVERIADLEYQLTAMTAERDQLLSDLNAGDSAYESLRAQLEAAQAEIADLRELTGLWQTLDQIGLDDLVRGGMTLVADALKTMLGVLGLLQSGLAKGQAALDKFIFALPSPQDGVRWLQGKVSRLADDLEWLTEKVEEVVGAADPFTTKVAEFVLWVLNRLPFGAGDKARAGMDAMQTVINSLPDLVEGINTDILDPLAAWFGDEEDDNLFGVLLNPVTDHLIDPAHDVLAGFTTFEGTYQDKLETPVEEALDERALIRARIQELQTRMGARV